MEYFASLFDKFAFGLYELRSLSAQETTATWTWLMALFTLIATIFAGGAAVLAYFSLRAAQRAASLQSKAYAYALSARFGDYNNVVLTVKNTGLTPASHFSVNATADFATLGQVENTAVFPPADYKTWNALGAGQEREVSILESNAIIAAFKGDTSRAPNQVLRVCGSIIYCTMENEDHLTKFLFYVDGGDTRFRKSTSKLETFYRLPVRSWWQFWKKKPRR